MWTDVHPASDTEYDLQDAPYLGGLSPQFGGLAGSPTGERHAEPHDADHTNTHTDEGPHGEGQAAGDSDGHAGHGGGAAPAPIGPVERHSTNHHSTNHHAFTDEGAPHTHDDLDEFPAFPSAIATDSAGHFSPAGMQPPPLALPGGAAQDEYAPLFSHELPPPVPPGAEAEQAHAGSSAGDGLMAGGPYVWRGVPPSPAPSFLGGSAGGVDPDTVRYAAPQPYHSATSHHVDARADGHGPVRPHSAPPISPAKKRVYSMVVVNMASSHEPGPGASRVPPAADWTDEEVRVFEAALAEFPEGTHNRWKRVAERLHNKTELDAITRYRKLCWDVLRIFQAPKKAATKPAEKRKVGVPWTDEEHRRFLLGLRACGNRWASISKQFVHTRTPSQVASHAQKWFGRPPRTGGDNEGGVIFIPQ